MNEALQASDFAALWAAYVNEGNIDALLNLYDEHSTLMPTFSPHVVHTQEQLSDYFTQLASRDALEVKLHDNTLAYQKSGESTYVITGIYSFLFKVDGTLLTFPSRFTFVVDLSNERPIVHHHSSQVPRNLS